jgi:hypothetical protein
MAPKKEKVPVTLRALVQRINRSLSHSGRALRRSRRYHNHDVIHYDPNLGEFYVVSTEHGWLVEKDVNVEQLARSLEVLASWETLDRNGV